MVNGYIFVVMIVAGLVGKRSILYGFLAGVTATVILYLIFNDFQLKPFFFSLTFGALVSIISSFLAKLFAPAFKGGNHNRSPYYNPMPGEGRGGGIIYTDEDEKNARQNERRIR